MTGAISSIEKEGAPAARWPGSLADQLLDEARIHGGAALLARTGMTVRLMKKLAECMLAAELRHHLLLQGAQSAAQMGNYRNGSTPKTVCTPSGRVELEVPRVRYSTFVPQLVARYQRSIPGFDDQLLILYGRNVGVPELQAHLRRLYGPRAWSELSDTLTEVVSLHSAAWQARRLDRACDLIYFDALQTQTLAQGQTDIPLFFALGMRTDGRKNILGFWIENTGGAAFWLDVLRELQERGLAEPGTIAADSLLGVREAAALVYPAARFRPVP